MSLRTKIALIFTLLTATMMLLLSVFVYVRSLGHAHEYFFTRLKVRASITAESQFGHEVGTIVRDIRDRHLQKLPQEQEFYFKNGPVAHEAISRALPVLPDRFLSDLAMENEAEHREGFRHYVGLTYAATHGDYIIVAVAYDENGVDQMTSLFNSLLLGFSASCLLSFFAARIFAARLTSTVSSMISRVNAITTTNMSERLNEGTGHDELAEMARTFNSMLDRLETAFDLQSNFISNASHELRTPLTAILGEAEIIMQQPRTPEDYVASIATIQKEAQRLDDISASLLKLSQISFDGKKQKIEPVSLDELLLSIKIGLNKRIPGNKVEIVLPPEAGIDDRFQIVCVRIWMELALTNIIQNSIKYSDNKRVLIEFSSQGSHFSIVITDSGIGIPQGEIKHIFEPFFRASNTSEYAGHGIGLPLASRIIRLHGGKISVTSSIETGTRVSLEFTSLANVKN